MKKVYIISENAHHNPRKDFRIPYNQDQVRKWFISVHTFPYGAPKNGNIWQNYKNCISHNERREDIWKMVNIGLLPPVPPTQR